MGWSDRILGTEEPAEPPKPSGPRWSEKLTSGGEPTTAANTVGLGDQPLNSVFTEVDDGGNSPGFVTQMKLGMVTDPKIAIKIAAKERFPELDETERESRYGVHNGELVYQGEDGKLRYETPDNWLSRLGRWGVRTSTDPTVVGATVGALAGGIPSVVVGAMGGEVWKKNIQANMGQQPAPVLRDAKDVGVAGVEALAGEGVGRGLVKGANLPGAKRGGQLAVSAGRDRSKINLPEVERLESLGEKFGIDLYPPSTTGSKRLSDKWKLLHDLPDTADDIHEALRRTTEQVDEAFGRQLNDISGPVSSLEAGTNLVNASKKAVQSVIAERRKLAGPLYKEAMERNAVVDIEPLVAWVDEGMSGSKADILTAYGNIKNILTKPDLPKVTPARESSILDASGKPAFSTPEVVNYETNLKGLHDALVALNHKVETSKNPMGELTPVGVIYNRARTRLREMLRGADEGYAQAMDLYREGSEFVSEIADATLIGNISKLEGDKRIHATQRLLSSADSDPTTVARARSVLVDAMGMEDTWNQSLRFELQRQFDGISKSLASADVQNIGGLVSKKMGSKRQMEIWKSAMTPDQFETWTDFMEVLDKTKLIFGKESMTTPRAVINEELRREGGSGLLSAGEQLLNPVSAVSIPSKIFQKANEVLRGRYNRELADSMLSEQAHQQLKQMKQLPAGSNELAGAFAAFLSIAAGEGQERKTEETKAPDTLPLSMRPTLKDLIERQQSQSGAGR